MDILNSIEIIEPTNNFTYTFERAKMDPHGWIAVKQDDEYVRIPFAENADGSPQENLYADDWKTIERDFNMFRNTRPEYIVGMHLPINAMSPEAAVIVFEKLLHGVAFMRAKRRQVATEEGVVNAVMRCINWLRTTDFYVAPASTRWHEAEPTGLLYHTLKVVNGVTDFWYSYPFANSVAIEDAVLCAMVHDWCKIDMYEKYIKNVKNEETGRWEPTVQYRYKDEMIPLGHGEKSAYLARQFFKLSLNEELAIVHHMQKWAAEDDYHQNALTRANKINPLNLILAFADSIAITEYYN